MNEAAALPSRERWLYGALAVFVATLWLATLSARSLFNPDEGRYAEIPREMLSTGDWVIPHVNGVAYIEKPPLQYWATALNFEVFGETAFAARLYTALAALGTLVIVALLSGRLWGERAGWASAGVLAGMLLFLMLGQLLTLDMSLTFYLTAALAAFLMAQRSETRSGRWMLVAWIAAALGVLTKGLVAALLPAAVLVIYSLISREFSAWRRLNLRWGLPLFLLITVPWHWLAARRLGDFLQFFFVHEHFARYLTAEADRQEPAWFYAWVFLAGSAPWTLSALRVVATGWRARRTLGAFNTSLFLWLWVVFVCAFFSLSDSKLMPYILPAMPALALLIASLPPAALRRDLFITAALTLAAGIGMAVASAYWPRVIAKSDRIQYFLPLSTSLALMAGVLAASGAFVLVSARRDSTRAAVFLGAGWCIGWLVLVRGAVSVAPIYSGAALADGLSLTQRSLPVYSIATYDQSFTFYLRHPVIVVHYRGELDYGLAKLPSAGIASLDEFIPAWDSHAEALAVMESGMFDQLTARGLPMRVLTRSANKVLVARR